MNKVKLLYDVVKTLKAKEVVTGVLQADVEKDQVNIFSIRNDFEKNLLTRQTKAKVTATVDYEGTRKKQQHHTGFTMPCPPERKHMGFRHGLKGKFAMIAFALSILDALQIEEQPDKTIVMSLHANDLPEEMKQLLHEKVNQAGTCHHRHSFINECGFADKLDLIITVLINKNYEVMKIVANAAGTQTDAQANPHNLKAKAELSFVW